MLSDNYTFLRTLEHRLQQLNDLQTHNLPSDEKELNALAKKMGFLEKTSFYQSLNLEEIKQEPSMTLFSGKIKRTIRWRSAV